MASFNTHLAIAKLYAERNKVGDLAAFYKGNIDPDLTDNKDTTHYGATPNSFEHAWVRVANKVSLSKFLKHNTLDTDLNLGRFLHLVTDQKLFYEFFGKDLLETLDHDQFTTDLYYSYVVGNPHLIKKYDLHEIDLDKIMDTSIMKEQMRNVGKRIDDMKRSNYTPKCIIDVDLLDAFINKVASSDLQNIALLVRKS